MTEHVEAGDPRLDPYRRVGDPAWLVQQNLFVAEGRLVVSRLMAAGRFPVVSVLVTEAAFEALREPLSCLAAPVYVCDPGTLRDVTGFNFHRGCLALAERPASVPPDALADAARIVALEGIGNPDNIGGVFRSAAAFGVDAIALDPSSADPLYRKALRTSVGTVLRMPFGRTGPWPDGLDVFRRRGATLVALTPDPRAEPVEQFAARVDPGARLVLMLGSEGAGLTPASLAAADVRVRIPMAHDIDSLNVVVAAGIMLAYLQNTMRG